jgi:pyridoxine kinase
MTQNLFNWAAANPTLQPLPIDVVSVQSQVVYGRVGNNVAIPILESFGLTVVAVPTVILSNTPHYPTIHGGALPTEWFNGYLLDLSARGALRQTRAILLGYLGNPAQAEVLARWISNLHGEQPSLRVIVDPVIGDHDHGVYVDPGMIEAYRRHLLPLAHGLTPNGFELERLTGQPAGDIGSVIAAARMLLTGRTQWVAVTSAAPIALSPAEMQVAVVTRDQTRVLKHPRIATSPKGTGDLFAAALTGHLLGGDSIFEATTQACNQVAIALDHTRRTRCAELMLPPVGRASCPG